MFGYVIRYRTNISDKVRRFYITAPYCPSAAAAKEMLPEDVRNGATIISVQQERF